MASRVTHPVNLLVRMQWAVKPGCCCGGSAECTKGVGVRAVMIHDSGAGRSPWHSTRAPGQAGMHTEGEQKIPPTRNEQVLVGTLCQQKIPPTRNGQMKLRVTGTHSTSFVDRICATAILSGMVAACAVKGVGGVECLYALVQAAGGPDARKILVLVRQNVLQNDSAPTRRRLCKCSPNIEATRRGAHDAR